MSKEHISDSPPQQAVSYTEKLSFDKHFFKILGLVWLVIFIIGLALLLALSEQPTVYNEFIVSEFSALRNKAYELNSFWFCAVLAAALVIVFDMTLFRKEREKRSLLNIKISKNIFDFFCIGILPNVVLLLIVGHTIPKLLWIAVFYISVRFIIKEHAMKAVLLLGYVYYGIIAVLVCVNMLFIGAINNLFSYGTINQQWLDIITILITVITLAIIIKKQKFEILDKALIYLQFPLPLIFLNNLISVYIYYDNPFTILFSRGYYLFFILIIVGLLVWNFVRYIKLRDDPAPSVKRLIFPSTLVTIFVFNSYFLPAKYLQNDFHHHGEHMLAWHQIVTHGRTVYEEFIPPSGLFPMVVGFFQNVLSGGYVTDYPAATNMVMALFAIITILLCYYSSNSMLALIIAVGTGLTFYNRGYLILPVILALLLPKLVKNRNLWLQAWIVLSFLAFLYYPLFGAAIGLSFAPFALMQLICFIKEKDVLKRYLKKWYFYFSWILILAVIAVNIPLVFRILTNILNASSQTLLADGINITHSQGLPANFLPYISIFHVRLLLFYGIRFTLPAIFMIVFIYIMYKYIRKNREDIFKNEIMATFLKITALPIFLAVSYTFSLVRADFETVLARTSIPIYAVSVVALVLLYTEEKLLERSTRKLLSGVFISILLVMPLISVIIGESPTLAWYLTGGFTDDTAKLKSAYVIPNFEGNDNPFIYFEPNSNPSLPLLGEGFGNEHTLNTLAGFGDSTEIVRENKLPVTPAHHLPFYAADLIVSGAPHNFVVLNKRGQLSITRHYEKERPVFLVIHPEIHYYIHRWMMDADYKLIGGKYVPVEHLSLFETEKNKAVSFKDTRDTLPYNLYNRPSELGNSLDTLLHFFDPDNRKIVDTDQKNVIGQDGYVINFDEPVDGKEFDVLYLELVSKSMDSIDNGGTKNALRNFQWFFRSTENVLEHVPVRIQWKTEDGLTGEILCTYGDGNLLIQLGVNRTWLLSSNTELSIYIREDIAETEEIQINKAIFLSTLLE